MPPSTQALKATCAPRTLNDVPGWLTRTDRLLFKWLLTHQTRTGVSGDLLELGTYQGRTAIHMARYLAAGEQLTVCDLFDLAGDETSIRPGARKAYRDLTQATFERNYLAFHATLPVIVRGRTDTIVDRVEAGSCRFVHIDASHMYDHVRGDLLAARKLLNRDGLVVFDDYRTEHTPGTAAAVWEAVATDGLRIVCATAKKFYGTWGDPIRLQDDLIQWINQCADQRVDVQSVLGQRLLRVVQIPGNVPQQATGSPAGTGQRRPPAPAWRRAAVALLPQPLTRAIRSRSQRSGVR